MCLQTISTRAIAYPHHQPWTRVLKISTWRNRTPPWRTVLSWSPTTHSSMSLPLKHCLLLPELLVVLSSISKALTTLVYIWPKMVILCFYHSRQTTLMVSNSKGETSCWRPAPVPQLPPRPHAALTLSFRPSQLAQLEETCHTLHVRLWRSGCRLCLYSRIFHHLPPGCRMGQKS